MEGVFEYLQLMPVVPTTYTVTAQAQGEPTVPRYAGCDGYDDDDVDVGAISPTQLTT